MKIAYLDCISGISGDMTLAALIDAGLDIAELSSAIDQLGLPDVSLRVSEVDRHGFRAVKINVEHPEQHAHRHLSDIVALIDQSGISETARSHAKAIFGRLAEAEAKVHGSSIEKVHFHEVGAIDSIVDIVGVAIGLDLLNIGEIHCSPVPTGTGTIQIAHGLVSVPAPATAELLQGIPLRESDIELEMTTPTGAAIVAALASQFGPLPAMSIESIGYGAGTADLPSQPNILRILIGDSQRVSGVDSRRTETVVLLETNLDDVSPEVIGHCRETLFAAGGLDVFTLPLQMKKGRCGTLLSVISRPSDADRLEMILFNETATLGIRRQTIFRSILPRDAHTVSTEFGAISGKRFVTPDQEVHFTPEFESCRAIAESKRLPIAKVYSAAREAFRQQTKR